MKTQKQYLGAFGEDLTLQRYLDDGATLLGRNVRYSVGEIDLILRSRTGIVIFAEVKTRRGSDFGEADAIDHRKITRMRKAAMKWLEGKPFTPLRFDVVTVVLDPQTGSPEITIYEDVDHGAR
ncbi:YraN family protein [Corynebacterium suranareeae]|nr:YraN family protein [Corynebacterium suranareeae]